MAVFVNGLAFYTLTRTLPVPAPPASPLVHSMLTLPRGSVWAPGTRLPQIAKCTEMAPEGLRRNTVSNGTRTEGVSGGPRGR
jgi:hypothetical protein